MKEENKKELKKGILTGAGTVASASAGVVVENMVNATVEQKDELISQEVSDAIIEDAEASQEIAQSAAEVEVLTAEATLDVPPTSPHQTEEPDLNDFENSATELESEANSESIEAAAVVTEVEEDAGSNVEIEEVSEIDADPDIVVVSVESEEMENSDSDVYFAMAEETESACLPDEVAEGPDYADIKDNDMNVVSPDLSTITMPDYVNDANVDSYTENI